MLKDATLPKNATSPHKVLPHAPITAPTGVRTMRGRVAVESPVLGSFAGLGAREAAHTTCGREAGGARTCSVCAPSPPTELALWLAVCAGVASGIPFQIGCSPGTLLTGVATERASTLPAALLKFRMGLR